VHTRSRNDFFHPCAKLQIFRCNVCFEKKEKKKPLNILFFSNIFFSYFNANLGIFSKKYFIAVWKVNSSDDYYQKRCWSSQFKSSWQALQIALQLQIVKEIVTVFLWTEEVTPVEILRKLFNFIWGVINTGLLCSLWVNRNSCQWSFLFFFICF